jgi:hypothetical protein
VYEAVGVIITLILFGRLLEAKAKAGTGEAIRALLGLQARTARVPCDGAETEMPIEDVLLGEDVVVGETLWSAMRSLFGLGEGAGRSLRGLCAPLTCKRPPNGWAVTFPPTRAREVGEP